MPRVSVIVPAYNAMRYLPLALESILAQSFQDFEIIIVDDGSRDGIKRWAAQLEDPRIDFFTQANSGSAAARNTGISHATGEYIAFLDADDLWASTKLEQQVKLLDEKQDVGLVYTWVATIDAEGELDGKSYCHSEVGEVWDSLIEGDLLVCGSTPMIRRTCFEEVGLFDIRFAYAQTWEMWLRIAGKYSFQVIPEILVHYRSHPGNISKKWQHVESNYKAIIEKVFANAPAHKQLLKGRCYGNAYLRVAWKVLQNKGGDFVAAKRFRKIALGYCPALKFSNQCIRLSLALSVVQTMGLDRYSRFRNLFHHLKHLVGGVPGKLVPFLSEVV